MESVHVSASDLDEVFRAPWCEFVGMHTSFAVAGIGRCIKAGDFAGWHLADCRRGANTVPAEWSAIPVVREILSYSGAL